MDGQLIGDPLDVQMFLATGWVLEEQVKGQENNEIVLCSVRPPNTAEGDLSSDLPKDSLLDMSHSMSKGQKKCKRIDLIRRFDFSSKLQRMSLIVRDNNRFKTFVKGSPERIKEICLRESLP